jgi:hypothetical protein
MLLAAMTSPPTAIVAPAGPGSRCHANSSTAASVMVA